MDVVAEVSKQELKQWLVENIGRMLIMSYDDIDCSAHLTEWGMDSQETLSLLGQMEDWLDIRFPASMSEELGSINELVDSISNLYK